MYQMQGMFVLFLEGKEMISKCLNINFDKKSITYSRSDMLLIGPKLLPIDQWLVPVMKGQLHKTLNINY